MALSAGQQLKYWGIATAVFVALLWLLGDVLMPFVLGGAIAYLLDPVADRLQKWGLSRGLSVAVITLLALVAFIVLVPLIIFPLLRQIEQLVLFLGTISERAPDIALE